MLRKFKRYSERRGVCRSSAEMDVYEDLIERGVPFEYESETLRYITPAVVHKYVPDFKIGNIYIEYKGWFKPEDRRKMLLVVEQNPTLDIRLLFMKDSKLYKGSEERYSDWAKKYGFKYAIGSSVPQEWIDEALHIKQTKQTKKRKVK